MYNLSLEVLCLNPGIGLTLGTCNTSWFSLNLPHIFSWPKKYMLELNYYYYSPQTPQKVCLIFLYFLYWCYYLHTSRDSESPVNQFSWRENYFYWTGLDSSILAVVYHVLSLNGLHSAQSWAKVLSQKRVALVIRVDYNK